MPTYLCEPMNTIVGQTILKDLANQIDERVADQRKEAIWHLYMGHPPEKWGDKHTVRRSEFKEPGLFEPYKPSIEEIRRPSVAAANTKNGSGTAPLLITEKGKEAAAEILSLHARPPSSAGSRHSSQAGSMRRTSSIPSMSQRSASGSVGQKSRLGH
mmetsp:Transcript_47844/g.102501  ORF Transcript_47844/g.102501 Transcript_47844/m.102501 type:complete len:157 (+) Transcript_47844:228-698(+)|eukprot:CAMPEP_0206573282 /NCGR_PEP_ID=MMETSP0325_2-20121206/28751_1 /ASSEMBLY_ACC=CAM_ASM_000347 /TAXON_ID=2866 /ORGANISM="Crypthecodinium cohnii, Strain Seligo" /LENGTH=156 /DNA_ID=CAMNT_0054077653 /DNA_START=164 /DNA_END=634 /DNA_ORIENTATION=+